VGNRAGFATLSAPNWSGGEGQDIYVRCYSNLDSVELLVNRQSFGSNINLE